MAEQTLSELVMNLICWIESLHEKNLKYEAQVETLSRDLAKAQSSNEQLEARLSAYQGNINTSSSSGDKSTLISKPTPIYPTSSQVNTAHAHASHVPLQHHHQLIMNMDIHQTDQIQSQHQQQTAQAPTQLQPQPTQITYQPIASAQSFVAQPTQYVWTTYDTSGNQVPYYDYGSAAPAAFQQQ